MTYYVSIHVFKTKMPISNSNTWNIILKFIKQWFNYVWFSAQLHFTMNAVNQGGNRERGSGVGGNSKSGRLPLIPWHWSCMSIRVEQETSRHVFYLVLAGVMAKVVGLQWKLQSLNSVEISQGNDKVLGIAFTALDMLYYYLSTSQSNCQQMNKFNVLSIR